VVVLERVEHHFNRRYGVNRRDVYLIRTPTGWQVLGREGGADGREVTHYFDREDDARRMLQRMLDAVPEQLGNWALTCCSACWPRCRSSWGTGRSCRSPVGAPKTARTRSWHWQVDAAPHAELFSLVISDHREGACRDRVENCDSGRCRQQSLLVGAGDEEDVDLAVLLAVVEDLDLTCSIQLFQELLDLLDPDDRVFLFRKLFNSTGRQGNVDLDKKRHGDMIQHLSPVENAFPLTGGHHRSKRRDQVDDHGGKDWMSPTRPV
jgi:hypothetical protein